MAFVHIFERVISIGIFLFLAFLSAYRIVIAKKDYKKIKKILIEFVIILCILSFFFVPSNSADLTRIRIYMNNVYGNMSYKEYLTLLLTRSTFTTHTFYFLVSKIGIKELLSVVTCFINYSIFCYILYDYSKRKEINGLSIANAFLLYLFTGQYMEVISGLRSMSAFSILFFCIYREFFQNKSVIHNLIFYLLAIGFHSAVVPLVIIRFTYLAIQKENRASRKIFNCFIFVMLLFFTLKYGTHILETTTSKAETYLQTNVYSYFWCYLSSIITLILILYVYAINLKVIKDKIPKKYRILFYLILCLDIIFGSIRYEYTIFRRYSRVVVMLFIPFLLEIFNGEKEIKRSGSIYVKKQNLLYYILMFIIMFIEISRGDLCGVRYFTLN